MSIPCHDVSSVLSQCGRTAMDHAKKKGQTSIVRLLDQVLHYVCGGEGGGRVLLEISPL